MTEESGAIAKHHVDEGNAGVRKVQTHHQSAEEEKRERVMIFGVKKTMKRREREILVWEEQPHSSMGIMTMPVICWGGTRIAAFTILPFNFVICSHMCIT